ncbi:hypothetical protein A9Q99_20190 [Gammaproteobacteria bacterium 45_16_T64]|nr:hypothetical protein A9Q99_20190 [Gammaproteobacteria bacterium 45_16_T64]
MWWDLTSLRLPLLAALIFVVPSIAQGNYPNLKNTTNQLIALWLLCAIVGNLSSGCGEIGSAMTTQMITVIVALLITDRIVNTETRLFWIIATTALSLGFHSSTAGFTALTAGGASLYGTGGIGGSFSGGNAFAMGTSITIFLLIFTFQLSTHRDLIYIPKIASSRLALLGSQVVFFIMIVSSIFLVISMFSRGSAIAMFLGLFLLFLLQKNKFKKSIVAFIVAFIAMPFIPIPEGYEDRIASAFESDEGEMEDSAASRPHFWRTASRMVEENPLGVGLFCYNSYYNEFDDTGGQWGENRSVHSSHFQILSETGYLGLFLWVMLHIVSFSKLWIIRKKALIGMPDPKLSNFYFSLSNSLLCSQVAFLFAGSFYAVALNDVTWVCFIIASCAYSTQKNAIEKKDKEAELKGAQES